MSVEIIKSIKFDDKNKEVVIKSYSSNVYPKNTDSWVHSELSKIYKEKGKIEAEKEILYKFVCQGFGGFTSSYGKFIKYLHLSINVSFLNKIHSYDCFDEDDKKKIKDLLYQKYKEYIDIVSKKEKYLIMNGNRYISKVNRYGFYDTYKKEYAKEYNYTDAVAIVDKYNSYDLKIIKNN